MATRSLLIAAALASMTVAGCGGLATPDIGPAPASAGPLEAYLYAEPGRGGGLIFDLNRAAHVAIFQIVPGQGTAMIYPRAGVSSSSGATFAGLRQVPFYGSRGDYYGFNTAPIGYAGPQFYLLVASEEPLRLSEFGAFGSRLRSAMGVQFASMNAYSSMERVVSTAVPNLESQNWTTDFYVHWPETLYQSPRDGLILITCGDYSAYVPLEMVLRATQAICPDNDQEAEPQPGIPSDSVQTVEPIRRPPVKPVTDRIASTQLERPREWDLRRRAAEEGRTIGVDALRDIDRPGDRLRSGRSIRSNPALDDSRPSGAGAADRSRPANRASPGSIDRTDRRPTSPSSGAGSSSGSSTPSSAAPPERAAVSRDNPPQ